MNRENRREGWIWSDAAQGSDIKVCFRGRVELEPGESVRNLEIWADSRYYLWINGVFLGTGPRRCWPEHPFLDSCTPPSLNGGRVFSVAVLVWHFGTSTSQYIHGPGVLYLSGEILGTDGSVRKFFADSSWKTRIHSAYQRPVPRINVSQPWLEMVDAGAFPSAWMIPSFNDAGWNAAVSVRPSRRQAEIQLRDTPMLVSRPLAPARVVEERRLFCTGTGIRIDYKSAFYPEDTSTRDRYQTGYLVTVIQSPVRQSAGFTLADRLWPEITERLIVNGTACYFKQLARSVEVTLQEGENLLLLDVSGARQRFTADLHVVCEKDISFKPPLAGGSALFYALGPFEALDIGNIVCLDGFDKAVPGEEFERAAQVRTMSSLEKFRSKMTPVFNVLFDGVKLRTVSSRTVPVAQKNQNINNLCFPKTSKQTDYEIVLDMGGEVSGYLQFQVEAEKGTVVDFQFAENMENGVLEIPDDLDTSLRYVCGEETPAAFRSLLRRGFRYMAVRVRNYGRDVFLKNLVVDEQLYPSRNAGSFSCSSSKLNQIWEMCRRTVELCCEDTFVDCPAFEQAFWTGDAYVMGLYRQYFFGDTSLTRHCLVLAAESMERSPLPECHLPAGVSLVLTTWAQFWLLACREYWLFTAERDFITEIYPWIEQCLNEFNRHIDQNGLLNISAWNFLDWAPVDTPYNGTVTHLNARLAECCRAAADLGEQIGKTEAALQWRAQAAGLAEAAHRAFWDPQKKAYRDCIHADGSLSEVFSVQSNLMMFLYGCVPEEVLPDVKRFLDEPPSWAVRPGSPFFAHFYYDYLFSAGAARKAVEGIVEQWTPMLEHGTCWETFKGFYKDRLTRSYCHGWSSAPGFLLGKRVLGIRILEPEFRKVMIAPQPGTLSRAEGCVPTPLGSIRVSWTNSKNCFSCSAELPPGMKWEITRPEGAWKTVDINVSQRPAVEK